MPDSNERVIPKATGPLETRWPCPVCIGVMMEKQRFGDKAALVLDFCPRCGGMWFDRGEVNHFANRPHSEVRNLVRDPATLIKPPCQKCQTPLDRNAPKCLVCGRANVLNCPVCDQAMERRETHGIMLDVCTKCHGVWFDNAELSAIWRLNVLAMNARRSGSNAGAMGAAGGDLLFNALIWTPDLVVYGGMAAAQGVGAAAEVAAGAAEGVFSTIMEIIGGLFD